MRRRRGGREGKGEGRQRRGDVESCDWSLLLPAGLVCCLHPFQPAHTPNQLGVYDLPEVGYTLGALSTAFVPDSVYEYDHPQPGVSVFYICTCMSIYVHSHIHCTLIYMHFSGVMGHTLIRL